MKQSMKYNVLNITETMICVVVAFKSQADNIVLVNHHDLL